MGLNKTSILSLLCIAFYFVEISANDNLPVIFKAESKIIAMVDESLKNEDLYQPMEVSFNGKKLLCKWEDGRTFAEYDITDYIRHEKDDKILYTIQQYNDNGLIRQIIQISIGKHRDPILGFKKDITFQYFGDTGISYGFDTYF